MGAGQRGLDLGLSETVDDADADGFDHRIDMIFARAPHGDQLEVEHGWVTGDVARRSRRATGLWPSDHGGVVLRLSRW